MKLPAIPVKSTSPCADFGCSACCHDIEMLLSNDDVARIAKAHPGLDFYFVAEDGYAQLRTKDAPPAKGSGAAPGQSPKPCIFLSPEGACTIHDIRPEGCRLYPATWDGQTVELDTDYCPHTDGFLLTSQAAAATRRLTLRLEREKRERGVAL